MADPAKEAATKQRIITHMNNDHAESLSLYAQHYLQLSPRASQHAQLKDITLNGMTILTSSGQTHTIPFNPPMSSFADARPRVVEMDQASRRALGISSIKVDRYIPPTSPLHIFVFLVGGFMFSQFALYRYLNPSSAPFYYNTILSYFPGGAETFKWLVRTLAIPVLLIHFGEAYMMDRTRLRRFNVPRGSALWWKWVVSCFIEGYGCWVRIDKEVRRKEKEADKAAH